MLPVGFFALIVLSTIANSWTAISEVGFPALFGPELVTRLFRATDLMHGLRAPLWGTVLLLVVTLCLSLPVSFAMAVVAREFTVPVLSRVLATLLGVLGGIPPVVYGLMALLLVQLFMAPKFAGAEMNDPSGRVRAGILHLPIWSQFAVPGQIPNSTLLAGILLALLSVPLITPLLDDALASVPAELKYGAYALGASRWHTLWTVVVPWASPGIVSAVSLAALLTIGELVVPMFVMGLGLHVQMPNPLWDVLADTPPLGPAGAAEAGGVGTEGTESVTSLGLSVAYFSGVLLLLAAFSIMAIEQLSRRWFARRLAR
jgi:phosphate transport system permease protein